MTRSRWDRILALGWVVYGAIQLFRAMYLFFQTRALAGGGDPRDFIAVSLFWLVLALLIIGGAGMAFGRRWAWISTLVLGLLYSAFSAFSVRAFLDIWTHFHPPIGETARDILPLISFWALTVWTFVRFFGRPWEIHTIGETH